MVNDWKITAACFVANTAISVNSVEVYDDVVIKVTSIKVSFLVAVNSESSGIHAYILAVFSYKLFQATVSVAFADEIKEGLERLLFKIIK
ncbi:hypothetical protein MKW92_017621, partial [Papaver armeniacum]